MQSIVRALENAAAALAAAADNSKTPAFETSGHCLDANEASVSVTYISRNFHEGGVSQSAPEQIPSVMEIQPSTFMHSVSPAKLAINHVIPFRRFVRHISFRHIAVDSGRLAPCPDRRSRHRPRIAPKTARPPSFHNGRTPALRPPPARRAAPRNGRALRPRRRRAPAAENAPCRSGGSRWHPPAVRIRAACVRPPRQRPAPPESGTRSKRVMRHGNSDSRISIGVMCRLLRCVAVAGRAVMAHAAAIGGADDLVLHGRLAGPALAARQCRARSTSPHWRWRASG